MNDAATPPIGLPTARKIRLPSSTSAGLLAHILKEVRERGNFARVKPWCDALAYAQEQAGDAAGARAIREAVADTPAKSTQLRPLDSARHAPVVEWRQSFGKAPRPLLPKEKACELDRLLAALRYRHRLEAAGVEPPARLLFSGPSGTGKTMTAVWLAEQLGLPIAIVQIDRWIGSHLGETAMHVRQAFEEASGMCVLFLDELDSLSANRASAESGVAEREMQRSTGALLQQLDACVPSQIVIGATNIAGALDAALERRLPHALDFGWLDDAAREELVRRWLPPDLVTHERVVQIASQCDATGAALRSRVMRVAADALLALWERDQLPLLP